MAQENRMAAMVTRPCKNNCGRMLELPAWLTAPVECDDCRRQRESDQLAKVREWRSKNADKILREIGFPVDPNGYNPRGYNYAFNQFEDEADQKRLGPVLKGLLEHRKNIILYSVPGEGANETGRGVGKTRMIGMLVHWYYTERAHLDPDDCLFIYAEEWARGVDNLPFAKKEAKIRFAARKPLLVIDDVGYETGPVVNQLMLSRIHEGRLTLMTYNGTPKDFQARYGARTYSRLFGAAWIQLKGRDYRITGGNGNAE